MVLEQNYQLLMTCFNNSDPKKHGGLKLHMRAWIKRWKKRKFKALRLVKYDAYPNDIKVAYLKQSYQFFFQKNIVMGTTTLMIVVPFGLNNDCHYYIIIYHDCFHINYSTPYQYYLNNLP